MQHLTLSEAVREKAKSLVGKRETFARETKDRQLCSKHGKHSGTAVIAFPYKDGIVMAADSQSFEWNKVYTHNEKKIVQISTHSALGVCGSVAMEQYLTQGFSELLSYLEMRIEQQIHPANQLKVFHKFLQAIWSENWFLDLGSGFIFAGVNPSGEPVLAEIDSDSAFASRPIAAIGCGGDDARAVIEQYCETNSLSQLSKTTALTLGVKAIFRAAYHDAFVGHPLVDLPMVAFITKGGYEGVPTKEMKAAVQEVAKTTKRRGR